MSDDFSARYRLLKCVLVEDGIRTHNAQEASTGRVVMVHITDAAGPDEVERLRAQLAQLPASDKNKVLETATLTSGFVVVTEFLPTPLSFRGWLAAHATGASAPSAPTGSSRGFTADGTAIPVSEVPSAPPTPLVTATGAVPQNVAPAAPAAGSFTALFGAPVDPMAAAAPPPPAAPASIAAPVPVAPPVAVAPPPAPPKASGGSFTELFGMPSDPLKATAPMTLGGTPVKTQDIIVAIPPASAPVMPVASAAASVESISALMAAPALAAVELPPTPMSPAPIAATPAPVAPAPVPPAAPPRKEAGDFTKMFSPGSLDMGAMGGFAGAPLGTNSASVRAPAAPPAPAAIPSSMAAAPPASMMAAPAASPMASHTPPAMPLAGPPPMAMSTPPAMPLAGPPPMAMGTPPAMPLSGPPPMAVSTPPAMPIPQPAPVPPAAAPTPPAAPASGFAEFGWGQNAAPTPAARKAPPGEFTAMFGAPATAAPMPDSMRPSPMSSAPPPTFSAMTPDQRLESPPVEPMHRVMGSNPNYAGGINQAGPSPIAPNLVNNYPYGAGGGYPSARPPEPSYPAAHASPLFAQEKKFAGEPSSTPGILPPPIFGSGSGTPLSALGGASPQIRGNAGPSEFTQLISNGSAPIVPTVAPSSAASSAASAAAAKPAKRRLPTGLIVIANAVILVFVLLMFFVYRRSVPSVSSLTPVVRAPIMPTAPKIPIKP